MDKEKILSHILEPDKKIKMRRLLDKVILSSNKHEIISTDFYDPYEIELSKSVLNHFKDLDYLITNGADFGEKYIIIIFPSYLDRINIDLNEFISAIKIIPKSNGLTHPDYMGALLNQGIIKEKIGDIFVHEDCSFVILTKPIDEFLKFNLKSVGNVGVTVENVLFEDIIEPVVDWKEKVITVSSLRIDILISNAYNLSRSDSEGLIKSGLVKLNWKVITDKSKDVTIGSMVSVRRHGRFKVVEELGISSKGKFRLKLLIL